MTASDVPWMMRICKHVGIKQHDAMQGRKQGEIWASSCSLCGGAVRPIAGGCYW